VLRVRRLNSPRLLRQRHSLRPDPSGRRMAVAPEHCTRECASFLRGGWGRQDYLRGICAYLRFIMKLRAFCFNVCPYMICYQVLVVRYVESERTGQTSGNIRVVDSPRRGEAEAKSRTSSPRSRSPSRGNTCFPSKRCLILSETPKGGHLRGW